MIPGLGQEVVHLDYRVNTEFEEREPIFSQDGRTMYFWRRESPVNIGGFYDPGDIWMSRRDSRGIWQEAEHLGRPLNGTGHDFVWHVSANHDTLWINQNPPGVNDIDPAYVVRNWDGRWSVPQRINIRDISYKGQYKDFFLTPERIMLIPNTDPSGFGGSDLFVAFPLNDTAWGRPMNLGSMINTSGDEDAPFLAADGRTLYFNSNGLGGEGDHDIFVSKRLDDSWRNWSVPTSVGLPINSEGYEFDFRITPDGKTAFWCSDHNSYGSNDIFYLDLKPCEVVLYPEGDQQVCEGQSITLEAGFTIEDVDEYQWYRDGRRISQASTRQLRVSSPGTYQVVRIQRGCEATSEEKTVRFISPPTAGIDAVQGFCLEDSVLLQARSSNGNIYQWQLNQLDIPAATGGSYWAKTAGMYGVRISNGSCASSSPTINLRRFATPVIFSADDTVNGILPTIPQWQWTNKLPRERRGDPMIRDVEIAPDGGIFVLSTVARRNRFLDQISVFRKQGLFRFSFPEIEQEDGGKRFLAIDPDGKILLADNTHYLSKYRADGQLMWSKNQRRNGIEGITTDPLGHIYTSGRFTDTLFIGRENIPAPERDGYFVAKHSSVGEMLWVKTFPVDRYKYDFGNAIHTDCMGNVYVAGGFRLIANFRDPVLRAGLKGDSFFVIKMTPEGEVIWGQRFSTPSTRIRTSDMDVDCEGNIYLTLNRMLYRLDTHGRKKWSGDLLQPHGATAFKTRIQSVKKDVYIHGISDRGHVFVTKLNRLDRQVILWQNNGANTSDLDVPAITADTEGNVIVSGISRGNDFAGAQFDLTSGSIAYLMKYGEKDVEFRREPISMCGKDVISLYTRDIDGVSYQWLVDGEEIQGANSPAYDAYEGGTYQVLMYTEDCERMSDPLSLTACGEDPPAVPAIAVVERPERGDRDPAPEVLAPEPVLSNPRIEQEITYHPDGSPRRIKKRKVVSQREIRVRSQEAVITIWDHAAADHDTISINVNGEWLIQKYELVKKKLVLNHTFRQGDNFIILYAHNLGTTPPNTASIMVDDGIRKQTLELRSTLRNCGTLKVRVE